MNPSIRSHATLFLIVAFLFSLQKSTAQSISFELPEDFFVCGIGQFEVTVSNNSGNNLTDVELTYNFTTSTGTDCGVFYLEGSVTSGSEADISNLGAPVFSLPELIAGESVTITFEAEAPCSTVDCIDGAEVFSDEVTLNWNGGSTTQSTDPYSIERALLVITDVEESLLNGSQGNVLERKITIVNSRPGALSNFLFADNHQGGIEISTDLGTVLFSSPTSHQVQLTGDDFATIGDGDELFEFNETICITETILVTDCGVEIPSTVSNLSASWGCGAEVCQSVSANAILTIDESVREPALTFDPITSLSDCFCGPNGYEQGLKVTNVGNGPALDLYVSIFQFFPFNNYLIDSASIRVDSAGFILPILPTLSGISSHGEPCDAPEDLTGRFEYLFPDLGPGESMTIFFDVYYCDTRCNRPAIDWWYTFSYFKPCPPDPFFQLDDPIHVVESGNTMLVDMNVQSSAPMVDDSIYTVNYELIYDSLSLLSDTLVLELALPCGMVWQDDNDLAIDGQTPFEVTVEEGDTFTVITANYVLPFSGNTVNTNFDFIFDCESLCLDEQICEDSLVTSCNAVDSCTIDIVPNLILNSTTTLRKCPEYPLGCNMQFCVDVGAEYDCPIDSICIEAPPGYVTFDFEAARLNYGLADDNNDRIPDGTGGANLDLVRQHRIIAGDTVRVEISGEVRVDVPGATLPYGSIFHEFFVGDMGVGNVQSLLTDGSGIEIVDMLLRIFDASSGSYFECPNPNPIVDDIGGLSYTYDLSAAALGSCVPSGFEFAEGDSIISVTDFRINHNLTPDTDNNPLLGNLIFSGDVFVFDQDTTFYDPLVCGCETQLFELSGYRYTILPGQYALPECEPSEFVGGSVFSMNLHEGNFFPFEYRNLLFAEDWTVTIPAPSLATLEEARMTFLNYQGGTSILNNVPLTFTGDNPYVIDFGQFQTPPLDEGFSALFQFIFEADCTIFGSQAIEFSTQLDFNDSLPEDEDPLDFSLEANSLRAMVPNLSADAVLCDLISFNNQLVFDFNFSNFPTEVAAQMSGDAPNTWMYVTSPSGLVTDFQLIDPLTGNEFLQTNGVFQLGDFPIDTIALRLIGLNSSCEMEPLELHYGWNCDPFTSQVQTPCYELVKPLSIISPPGEIDFLVESPSDCYDLCDTVDYHSLEIFNAQLGAVYDLTVNGLLPPGLLVLPGSSEVEYPTGSGQFFPIGDPTSMPGGVIEWPLSELFDSLEMGLPGIGSAPQNSITLRFLSLTDCDLVASAFSLFTISAEQVCGIPTNTVTRPSDPVCINGVTAPYSTNINLVNNPGFGCSNLIDHEVSLTATADIPPGACVSVTLPSGVLFESGSCLEFCQTSDPCLPEFDGVTTTWNIPTGIEAGQLICFNFVSSGWSALECGPQQILIRTANETQAFCEATGQDCSVKVQTGALLESFEIEKPEFDLDNFEISASQNGATDIIDFSIDIINESVANEPPIILDFFIDTDGNGTGDVLVNTENVVATLSSGQSETVTGSFNIPSGNLCNLVAYINPEDQCACAIDSAYVTVPISYLTEQSPTVCSEEEISIGVDAMTGFTYQWEPADCLFDEQMATTIFSCANDEIVPVTYDFVLSETDGGTCEINNLISVTVQPVPGIAFADSPICDGQAANIAATDGVTFEWSGPGVEQGEQLQTVMPSATTTYSVTVTDDEGCSGMESVDIIVNPNPVADAGPDINVCPGQIAQLNAPNISGLDYLWSPTIVQGSPALDDPTTPDPVVLTNQTTTFTLEVTDENGCSGSDIAVVDFNGNIELEVPADLTICLGSSATLIASGADSYLWTPSGDCQDPPACSTIEVMPTVTTTYTVEASTVDGCSDSGEVTVNVSDSEIFVTLEELEICFGESVIIFGEEVSSPGTYQDTIIVAGADCDTIFSQDLFVFPPVDTMISTDTICEGEFVLFENMEVTELGLTCVSYETPVGCDSTVCLDLTVLDAPDFILSIEPDTANAPGTEITLSIEPSNFDSIIWTGGGIGDECLNEPTCTDILGETDTIYNVTVFDGSCSNTVEQLVSAVIECEPAEAKIPNVFTPNGDGVNDVFTIVAPDAEEVVRMEIWNRWGEKVYDGSGPWDGTQDGEPAGSDVYVYIIEVGCPAVIEDAEEEILKGDVTLLR